MKHFATIGRWMFGLAAAVSLLLCLLFGGLWARSVGHEEVVFVRYDHWTEGKDLQFWDLRVGWFYSTLRLEIFTNRIRDEDEPSDLMKAIREQTPPGLTWNFIGETTRWDLRDFSPGFAYQRTSSPPTLTEIGISVRPWLPTLLAAVLPAIWFVRYRQRQGTLWRFGLREVFALVTVFALGLGVVLWLRA